MLIGYARVSKADGSQSLDLQRDALRAGRGQDDQPVMVAVSAVYKSSQERSQQGLVSTTKAAPNSLPWVLCTVRQ